MSVAITDSGTAPLFAYDVPLDDPLSEALRKLMMQRGDVGLGRAAIETALTPSMLSLLLRGKTPPGRATMASLVAAYGFENEALMSLRLAVRNREVVPA